MTPPHADGLRQLRIGWKPYSYNRTVPSARLRTFIPVAELGRMGYRVSVVPPDGSGSYDCVVFQKAYRDRDVELAEQLHERGVKVVFDLCDNHFYNPEGDDRIARRAERLQRIIDRSDLVTVSTPELAGVVRHHRSPVVINDAFEPWKVPIGARAFRRLRRRGASRTRPLRLVWFGSSGSEPLGFGLVHLGQLVPMLETLSEDLPVTLTVISDSRQAFERHLAGASFPTRYVPWSQRSFARTFSDHEVCLIPVVSNPYTICKTSNRVRTSLAIGVPVVASPLPRYEEFADWILFENWAQNIQTYASDPELAARHVAGARAHIEHTCTPANLVGEWLHAVAAVMDGVAT